MKTKLLYYLFATAFFIVSSNILIAQDTLDVPPLDGANKPNLVKTILGDTSNGGRKNLNRVYRLQRGAVYVMDAKLVANYDLNIMSNDDNPSTPTRPAMIVRGKNAAGANIKDQFQFTKNKMKVKFRNIIFQGYDLDRKNGDWTAPSNTLADSCRITYEKCIFNGWQKTMYSTGKQNSFFIHDCELRNNEVTWHQFVGQGLAPYEGATIDSFVVTNSTSFNNNSYFVFLAINQIVNYVLFDHNTIYTNIVDALHFPHLVKANITNNIFYGDQAYGQTKAERQAAWFDSDELPKGIISIDTVDPALLSGAGLTEAGRRIVVKNNAYFWPAKIKNFWTANDSVDGVEWMNSRTQAMFNADTQYPNLIAENNFEADPVFTNTAMDTWIVDKVLDFCLKYREGKQPVSRNYDLEANGGEVLLLKWPMPEQLAYSSTSLLNKGLDGLNIGDLNWFPIQRAQYKIPKEILHVNTISDIIPEKFILDQNYPNPFNPETAINYSIPTATNVTIAIYNMLGQSIATLVQQHQTAGEYSVRWNGKDNTGQSVASGMYIYQLTASDFVSSRKMMLMK